jgi:cytochrome c peroxidase
LGKVWRALGLALLAGCGGGGGDSASSSNLPDEQALSAQALLGQKIFSDPTLSASGRQSCASCHSEARAHGPDDDLAVQLGGPLLDQQGNRSAPVQHAVLFRRRRHPDRRLLLGRARQFVAGPGRPPAAGRQ